MLPHVFTYGGKAAFLHQFFLCLEVGIGVIHELFEESAERFPVRTAQLVDQFDELEMGLIHRIDLEVIARVARVDEKRHVIISVVSLSVRFPAER